MHSCYYLKLKLKLINKRLSIDSKNIITNQSIIRILYDLKQTHKEILNYNSIYWSQYIFLFLFTIISIIDLFIYLILFGKQKFNFSFFTIYYFAFICTLIVILMLNTISSVSTEAFNSYKLLIKFKNKFSRFMTIRTKLKVKNMVFIIRISIISKIYIKLKLNIKTS